MVQAAQESSVYDPEFVVESSTAIQVDQNTIQKDNEALVAQLHGTMTDGRNDLVTLRNKLGVNYWVIIVLSVVMFIAGIVLLSVPAMIACGLQVQETHSRFAAESGIVSLVALFLLRPSIASTIP